VENVGRPMKVGDLVVAGAPGSAPGLVLSIDKGFYDGYGCTRDRVLVLWPEKEYGLSHEESTSLEVINDGR